MNCINVLIVEDEILIAETIRIYLEERGHFVTDIAISYEEAQSSLQNKRPDLVLLDIRLYGSQSGIDFAKFLIENFNEIPFVYLTSQFDRRILENALETNPNGYLTKPIQKESLWTTVELAYYKFSMIQGGNKKKKIHLNDGHNSFVVDEDDIVYISSEHVYINVFVEDHPPIMIRQSLSNFAKKLNPQKFVQCHRGYVVNIAKLTSWNEKILRINDVEIPVSRSKKADVSELINLI